MGYPVPVLFLIFNRPDFTDMVFEAIAEIKPQYLYIAADGPRPDKPDDIGLCTKTRSIIERINWNCEVKTLLRDKNLGCRSAVSEAISWFFENVSEGVILEDDCLPDKTFFPFCAELLEKYRFDNKVMSISGSNLLPEGWKKNTQSYHLAHGGIWGWATWKRAWSLYDIEMKSWPEQETKAKIKTQLGTPEWYNSYYGMFESSFNKSLNTWDIQWFYSILINNGTAINPSVNLVKNIGYGNGTHTHSADDAIASLTLNAMNFPLIHPQKMLLDIDYLKQVYAYLNKRYKSSILNKALRLLKIKS
ncbi:nucleotide-diphospho-sugar transferase [Mucilaginibacter sp. SMC90]|uniref:nucleotide-diphospho-sugar transferase n=1 Tax=Mucilaginibacter sp. SMC90 TaxID=2929803 RepID=UPI001FB290D0|nr:nucleotide-diphospho-sugar transferase [Mucilaginibacter sp. SMC90]UOE48311.1 nucleotide-diphospho-sugar transferase [Mucilaginibacter sp. SMC90]